MTKSIVIAKSSPYEKLLNRKRTWTPIQTEAGQLKEGAEETIFRALAIRHMELPVGEFIKEALEDVPLPSLPLLESNIKDEKKHDLALGFVANSLGVDQTAEDEAVRLRDAWMAHPDHTVLKAMVAEKAIFFTILPFFRFCGDAALRTVSADISRDEQIHVAGHTMVCKQLGYTPSPSLDKLRKATVQWIYEPLGINTTDRYLDRNFYTDSSDSLMYNDCAPNFESTKAGRMPAFFEHSAVNLPQYA